MVRKYGAFIALFFTPFLGALGFTTGERPWLGTPYLLEIQPLLQEVRGNTLNRRGKTYSYTDSLCFLHLPLEMPLEDRMSFGLSATFTSMPRAYIFDSTSIWGKIALSDDIAGDLLSSSFTLKVTQASGAALNNLFLFHHACTECEGILSFGKEWSKGEEWTTRLWGSAGYGMGIKRFPWLHGQLGFDVQATSFCWLSLWLECVKGGGALPLPLRHFHGYGSIAHQSLDLACLLAFKMEWFRSLRLEYRYRPYARNAPQFIQSFLISCEFSLL